MNTREVSGRVLFLCQTLPYPPNGGVFIRSYYTFLELAEAFDVEALCFERSGGRQHHVDAALEALREIGPTEAFPVPQEDSELRRLVDHGLSVLSRRVFTVYKHRSREFKTRLCEMVRSGRFDLVHFDSLDLSYHLPFVQDIPVVCVHHNIESQLLDRRAGVESNPVIRRYLEFQAKLQRKEERRWCDRVALNVTVSEEDRATLLSIAPDATVEVVPNGVDIDFFSPAGNAESKRSGLVFVGSHGWFPNRDGMEFFCEEILPRIRARTDDLPVTWVGGMPERDRRRFEAAYDIRATGFVEDIRPYLHQAACYIVPLRVGGGTRLKILDAWAMGNAVVSTSQGCEGLATEPGDNILVADDPQVFSEAVVRVLENPCLRKRLGREGRKTVAEQYAWDKIGDHMADLYRRVIRDSAGGV